MKSFFALFFCVTLALASANPPTTTPAESLTIDVAAFEQIVEGILLGIGAAEGLVDIQPCLVIDEDAIQNIEIAIQHFEKRTPEGIAQGFAALRKALLDLPTAMKECEAASAEIAKLLEAFARVSNPTTFILETLKNLIFHGVGIFEDVETAVKYYRAQDYKNFGYYIGEAFSMIFLYGGAQPPQALPPVEGVLLLLRGVVEGISTDINFNQLSVCINDADTFGSKIDEAIQNFATGKTEAVIAGVKLLGEALDSIPHAIQDCQLSYGQLQKLLNAIAELKDPRSLVYHITQSLIVNNEEIWDEISAATADYKEGNFEAAGKNIGSIIALFIDPNGRLFGTKYSHFVATQANYSVNPNNKFANWTVGQIKSMLGTELEDLSTSEYVVGVDTDAANEDIPQNFSAYEQWPECEHPILDQAHCGSCWAFGASEAFSDRLCVASQGKINVQLSPQYLVSCGLNMGCNGGILSLAWITLWNTGLPTLQCDPYTSGNGSVTSCSKHNTCADGSEFKKYYLKPWSIRWYMTTNSIKAEILKNGPVETAFYVFEDFMSYSGGIYTRKSGSFLGGHAVKIVGWGTENGQDYWLVANSWGTDWGINGFFKIALDACLINRNVVAGVPDLERSGVSSFDASQYFLNY